ncbi:hypothetical protein J2X86_002669 [Acinetobacter lwoffii]|jgi:hypothetical protein|uniref:DUF4231 domain-containing protein n=1 Tax=Acinetobacter lwoffii TaxID=28090 RepID=A0AAW8LFN3_ACILW|nr:MULTISPECIES: hypothetical protein [Acinetobacter]MDR6630613.1 hypothetical protein [Acinetobacter lwoffii]
MEMDWKLVAPITGVMIAIITLFLKRHEITNLKHKKISDRLVSSIQYFEKYYDSGNVNQLVLDRAAQDLAKSSNVDHNLVNKLIEFHQNYLVSFDHMIFLFDQGINYISYTKGQTLNISQDLSVKPFLSLNATFRRYVLIGGYFVFASLGMVLLLVLGYSSSIQVFVSIGFIFISVVFIALALLCLVLEDQLKDAVDFINKINEANVKYKNIKKPKTIILLERNGKST